MTKEFSFKLDTDEDLIIVRAWMGGYALRMALDTAATHTVIDLNALIMKNGELPNAHSKTPVETASGIIETEIVDLINFESLGINRSDFPILTYDFLKYGVVSSYDGVIGLDFFRNTILTIDFQKHFIILQQ